jgi:predicted permease
VQVALACVLLVAAGLLVRSLRNALEADLGFATRAGVVISIDLPSELPPDRGQAFYREALQRTQSIPGVEVAALSTVAPLNRGGRRTFHVADYQPAEGEDMELPINVVSPGYFAAMGIPVVAGRVFDDTDRADGNLVVMVNAEFARRFLPNGALGKRVRDARRREFTIVGVAGATALGPPGSPRLPVVYYPLAQSYVPGVRLIAKTSMDPSSLLPVVAREVKAITSQVAVFRPVTIRTSINDALTTDRLLASLVGACGVLALLLATVGLYGMVAYSVATKAREISIRIALGASAQRVWQLVIQESMRLTTAGIVIGGALAIAVGIGMRAMLYQVSPVDAWTFGAVLVMLFAVTLIAAWVPLRRALRVDPANVLRQI